MGLIVSVPDHCLSFYFKMLQQYNFFYMTITYVSCCKWPTLLLILIIMCCYITSQ